MADITPTKKPKQRSTSLYQICADWQTYAAKTVFEHFGRIDGLVNNAAGNFISRTQDLSHRGFDAIASIVFHGTFYVTHSVAKRW